LGVLVVLLAGSAGLGCGASYGANGTASNRPLASPAQLAGEIDRAQAVLDNQSGSALGLRGAAVSQQLAFRQLADHRPLRRPTLARLTPRARSAAKAALRASGALSRIVPAEHRFPDWRIIAPPPPDQLLSYYRAAAAAYKIPWQYLASVELVETRMGRIRGLSPAGAKGPMQFMPATWAQYGRGSITSQRDSIMAAARFLKANGAPGNIARALLHYNPSQAYVVAVESYAHEMQKDERAFRGYYYWQVLYQTTKGTFLLPLGYPRNPPKHLPG
jgi:soluble lytic murein transglycosylase-like protein